MTSQPQPVDTAPARRPLFADWLAHSNDVTSVFLAAGQNPDLINLAGGLPEPALWPVDELAELAAEAVRNHPVEALAFRKAAHLDGPFAAVAGFIQAQVQLRGEAPVEAQLFLAKEMPLLLRAIVEKGQGERLLQLPGMLAGEQHPRDVGLDQAHTTRRVGQHAGLAQAGEQFFGCVHGIGLWGHPGNGSP